MRNVLNCGFDNYILCDQLVAILDARNKNVKSTVKRAKESTPNKVMDICKGRKHKSILVLTGDRFVISPVEMQTLVKRLGVDDETPWGS